MKRNINNNRRIVLKIGTSSLTYPNGKLNLRQIEKLCQVTTNLQNSGKEVIVISSGAIGAGIGKLELKHKPTDLQMKQATAAIGQAYLMQVYQKFYSQYSQTCAQILLTKDVTTNSIQRQNVIRTLSQLMEMNVIPIINENDTVSTDEIEGFMFSDNDNLSAVVSELTNADLLIILSDINGLQKKENGVLQQDIISYVECIDSNIYNCVSESKSKLGTGGMSTKLKAIEQTIKSGTNVILCNSDNLDIIYDCVVGRNVGTFFKGVS